MYLLAKVSPLVLLIGGGSCIPYLLNSTPVNPSSTLSSTVQATKSLASEQTRASSPDSGTRVTYPELQAHKLANCEIGAEDKVSKAIPRSSNYVFLSCDNSGRDDSQITAGWKVWIPKELLKQEQDWSTKGQKIDIKTETDSISDEGYMYKTTFESESLSNRRIDGKWGLSILEGLEEEMDSSGFSLQVYKVEVTDSGLSEQPIYLYLQY